MPRQHLYNPRVLWRPFDAQKLDGDFTPSFFIRVDINTIGLLRGMLAYMDDDRLFSGTAQEVQNAIHYVRDQFAEPLLTIDDICPPTGAWGANFRVSGNMLQAMQGPPYPEPIWEYQIVFRDGLYVLQFRTDETP